MTHTATTAPRHARLGRAALITVVALWVLILALRFSGGLILGGATQLLTVIFGAVSYVAGVALAIASLAKREPKKLAIITLLLLLGGPLLIFVISSLVWLGYGLGLQ